MQFKTRGIQALTSKFPTSLCLWT